MTTQKETMWTAFKIGYSIGKLFINKPTDEIENMLKHMSTKDMADNMFCIQDLISEQRIQDNAFCAVIINAYQNDYASFCDFEADIKDMESFKHLSKLDKQRVIVYAQALFSLLSGNSRLQTWDFLFEKVSVRDEIYKELLNTYYVMPSLKDLSNELLFNFRSSLHLLWEGLPFVNSVRLVAMNGGNADINIAVMSALNRIIYGIESIPESWVNAI